MSPEKHNSRMFQLFVQKVRSLDLGPIAYQLTRSNSGPKWTKQQAIKAITRYLAFLYLVARYPQLQLVPTQEIDEVWHQHILDTQKYTEDCQILFGRFVHHFPYLGTRGEVDQQNLQRAYTLTQALFRECLGMDLAIDSTTSAADCEPLQNELFLGQIDPSQTSLSQTGCAHLVNAPQQRPSVEVAIGWCWNTFEIL